MRTGRNSAANLYFATRLSPFFQAVGLVPFASTTLNHLHTDGHNMAPQDLRFICKETRLGLEPPSASSIVIIRVSSSATHSRSNSRRLNGIESSVLEEEKAYRLKNLSTASSIYHRKHHSSPRSFLWRILEEGTVLSIRVVDVCRQEKEPDAQLILNLQFQSAIRPFCVSFADPKEHDSLTVFALDHTNTLYTVTLRPDIFRKRSVAENGLGEACKAYLSSAFSFKHPHRLVAVSSDQLVVTLHDGGLLKFDRNKSHDGRATISFHSLIPIANISQQRLATFGRRHSTML